MYSKLQDNFLESISKKTLVRLGSSPSKTTKDPSVKPATTAKPAVSVSPEALDLADASAPERDTSSLEFHYWSKFIDAIWNEPKRTVASWKNCFDRYCRNCQAIPECPPHVSRAKFDEWTCSTAARE